MKARLYFLSAIGTICLGYTAAAEEKSVSTEPSSKEATEHHKTATKNLDTLTEHLIDNHEALTDDHMDAVTYLHEQQEHREAILRQAQKEGRPLTPDEVKEIQDDAAMDIAAGLLPQHDETTRKLSQAIIQSQKQLGAHLDKQAGAGAPASPSPALASSEPIASTGEKKPEKDEKKLSPSDKEAAFKLLDATDKSVSAYEKAFGEHEKTDVTLQNALTSLKNLQSARRSLIESLHEGDGLSEQQVQKLHTEDEINVAISVLADGSPSLKQAKEELVTSLRVFAEWVARLEPSKLSPTEISLPAFSSPSGEKPAPSSPSEKKSTEHTDSPATPEAKESHKVISQHLSHFGSNLEKIRGLIESKDSQNKEDHEHALEYLEELHEKRSNILAAAEKEDRHLSADEAKALQESDSGLHTALGLLPSETPEEIALKSNLLSGQSDLLSAADAHINLLTTSSLEKASA